MAWDYADYEVKWTHVVLNLPAMTYRGTKTTPTIVLYVPTSYQVYSTSIRIYVRGDCTRWAAFGQIRRAFSPFFSTFFFVQFFNLPYFPVFFSQINVWNLTNLFFLLLENFTKSDRTPPYIVWYIPVSPVISKLWKLWKKRSPIRMSLSCETEDFVETHLCQAAWDADASIASATSCTVSGCPQLRSNMLRKIGSDRHQQ